MIELIKIVPKNYLSFISGKLAEVRYPRFVSRWMINKYIRDYNIDLSELAEDPETYPSLASFFTRDLKPGVRPIKSEIVSPVDGTLRSSGSLQSDYLEDIKGQGYTLDELFGGHSAYNNFKGGTYYNFYLAPKDYHHIHSPISGDIFQAIHIPGKLWPVNDWSLQNIPKLFAINERIITIIQTKLGKVAVVMVGATNVGKIMLSFDASIVGNKLPCTSCHKRKDHNYDPAIPIKVGDRIGTFNLGSSVVLLFEQGTINNPSNITNGSSVKYGQPLSSLSS